MDHPKTVFDLLTITWGYFAKGYSSTSQHVGIDLRAPAGTKIGATSNGRVVDVNGAGQDRYLVIWDGHFSHVYGHISPKVKLGDDIEFRQEIGVVLDHTKGPHLHYGLNSNLTIPIFVDSNGGKWGWGAVPFSTMKEQAAGKGWVDPRMTLFSMNLASGGTTYHMVLNK